MTVVGFFVNLTFEHQREGLFLSSIISIYMYVPTVIMVFQAIWLVCNENYSLPTKWKMHDQSKTTSPDYNHILPAILTWKSWEDKMLYLKYKEG